MNFNFLSEFDTDATELISSMQMCIKFSEDFVTFDLLKWIHESL